MDIEFVYDAQKKILNIVQARPIPAGKRKYLDPSAVSPHYLGNPMQTLRTINGLQVITPEVNAVGLVTDSSQVIICKDIKDALDEYLKPDYANRDIRAVIVQNYTPDNSHEAGQFNLNSLPVLQVADISLIEKMVQEEDKLIVVDPQHNKIYQLNPSLKNGETNPDLVEKSLYEAKVLEKGIFASTLSAYISPRKFNFNYAPIQKAKPIEQAMKIFKESDKPLGDLVHLAELGDEYYLNLLLSIAFEVMSYQSKIKQKHIESTPSQKLKSNFEMLETPRLGEVNDSCKIALAQILTMLSNLCKKGLITAKVYKQAMIVGSELAILLDRIEHTDTNQDKKIIDALYLEYFNIKRKFEGCITTVGNKDVLVQSVLTDLFNLKHKKNMEELAANEKINLEKFNKTQKIILYEVSKLSLSFTNSNLNENWQKFCLEVCSSEKEANLLAAMVADLVKMDIHENWLTLFFTKALKDHNRDRLKAFKALHNDYRLLDFQAAKEGQRIISELEAQIRGWSDKTKFDRLYKELGNNISQLDELLKYSGTLSNIEKFLVLQSTRRFIDVIDRTIKSLAYSLDYENNDLDNELRAKRFRELITIFHNCLKPWLKIANPHESKMDIFHKSLNKAIQDSIVNDKDKITKSSEFDVRKIIVVDTVGKGISMPFTFPCKTLEDCFSCIHQNFISVIDEIQKQQDLIMGREFYPPVFAQFEEELMKLKGKKIGNYRTPISNPNVHLNTIFPLIYYSIPLSIHNAMVTVFQKTDDEEFYLQFVTGSPFSEEMHRWDIISAKANFDIIASGMRKAHGFEFKHEPHFLYRSVYCVPLTKENIPAVLKIMELAIAGTYQNSYANHSPDDEARFLLLEKMDDLTLKNINTIALNLISQGYFIRSHFFNTNSLERMNILHKLLKNVEAKDTFSFDEQQNDEEKVQEYRLRFITTLLNKSNPIGLKQFFSHLYTHVDFDDAFCMELSGYNKMEFTQKFFSSANYDQKVMVYQEFEKILDDSSIEQMLKSDYPTFKRAAGAMKQKINPHRYFSEGSGIEGKTASLNNESDLEQKSRLD